MQSNNSISIFYGKKKKKLTIILINAVRKALLFGCTESQITILFNILYRIVKKAKTMHHKVHYIIKKENTYQNLEDEERKKKLNEEIKDFENSLFYKTMEKNSITYKKNKVTIKEYSIEIVLIDRIILN